MKTEPIVLPATDAHCVAMAPRLRAKDCLDIVCADRLTAMRETLEASAQAWTWVKDGDPAAMFGVIPRSLLGGAAHVWLFTTDAISTDLRTFWTGSKRMLDMLATMYPRLEGAVDPRFAESVRWLRRLGFDVSSESFDFRGQPFLAFAMERGQ